MTQQKSLKRRVRARMDKTGERYTAARRQVLAKAPLADMAEAPPGEARPEPIRPTDPSTSQATPTPATPQPATYSTSDAAMRKATGRGHEEWFALIDAWGGTARTHAEIAEWLSSSLDVPMWWRQSITVDYERARGMRRRYQMADGFSVGASRTVAVAAATALGAFTDTATRHAWLPGTLMRPRPSRAKLTARFDWSDPKSRVLITITPKGLDKVVVTATHEQIPDEAAAERLKGEWRAHLAALKAFLEHA